MATPVPEKTPAAKRTGSLPLRSRSGCLTCRTKHLKCDETKPNCQLCLSRGIKCGGYNRGLKWSTKHEKHAELADHDVQLSPKSQIGAAAPKRRRGRPRRKPLPGETSSVVSGSAVASNPGDTNWGLFSEFAFEKTNPPVEENDNAQLPDPPTNAICNDFSPPFDLDIPIGAIDNLQWTPDTLDLTTSIDGYSDGGSDLSLFPVQQSYSPVFIPPAVSDVPSSLVEFWFRDVCSLWSQYDSPTNSNRTLATALWSSSEAVSTSLQSMSSAYLSSKLPHMKKTSILMMSTATKAIENELQVVKSSPRLDVVPLGLIYGLFCIGTSICWLNATQLGIPFLKEAKALLYRINRQKRSLTEDERRLLRIFNKSWTYCELLLSVVSDTNPYNMYELDEIDDVGADEYPTAEPAPPIVDDIPHPWTGVSNTVSRLFTKTMRLCRNYRYHLTHPGLMAMRDHTTALKLIEEAKSLEEKLLGLDFESAPTNSETGDQKTPCRHLIDVAEAYRLAGLIHIYQTFPDLVLLRLPSHVSVLDNALIPWEECITPLSLRLVKLIQQLPPDSGSKMTQPLLCITAATGLRFDSSDSGSETTGSPPQQPAPTPSPFNLGGVEDCSMSEYIGRLIQSDEEIEQVTTITESRLKIVDARCFLLNRLDILETVLPPRPIIVAKSLVQAIWDEYDKELPGFASTHWIDVMERKNLRSLFG
ncbi:Zn(2)-C6 fungal-type domain-containing protein [Fusarium keratoplasticum]|uniref:Zn(2)-C6 fungal-type domain-containing protein n=1 Tax=Fusarium keratoplasticum TaxID=1328300 RepID=A0ACC0R7R0_9HYPO|nr:Zn(2)-C6 fungal-type domain-containing protein [Fusarium keratoplasticum]KAI8679319.1 Zn(2)-C6 fungal-type domain-containing protein [Fusarium keratoplasticum]